MCVSLFCQCSGACNCSKPTYMPPKIIKDGYAAPGIAKAGKLDYFTGLPIAKGTRVISFYDNCGELIGCVCAYRKPALLNQAPDVTTAPSNPSVPACDTGNAPIIFDPEGSTTNPNGPTKIWLTMPDGCPKQVACIDDIPKGIFFTKRTDGCYALSDQNGDACVDNDKDPVLINRATIWKCLPDGSQQLVYKNGAVPVPDDKGNEIILSPKEYAEWVHDCDIAENGSNIYCVDGKVYGEPEHEEFTFSGAGEQLYINGATDGTYDIATNTGTLVDGIVEIEISNPSDCFDASICVETVLENVVIATSGATTSSRANHAVFLVDPSGTVPQQGCFLGGTSASVTNNISSDNHPTEGLAQAQGNSTSKAGKSCMTIPKGAIDWVLRLEYNMEQLSINRANTNLPNPNHPDFVATGADPKYDMYADLRYCVNLSTKRAIAGSGC